MLVKMKIKNYKVEIEIPEGVEARVDGKAVVVKGAKGEVRRVLSNPQLKISVEDGKITINAKTATKREKTMIGSFRSHIKNMITGVTDGYVYQLKICSGHFPMNVSVSGKEFIVKNFIGEKVPRKMPIKDNVTVKVEGDIVKVEGKDIELAGQTSASIEQLTKRTKYDRRIFQDGIYIISKPK